MPERKIGALPDHTIEELMEAGHIKNADAGNIQPASLDLTLTDEIYRMPGVVQPLIDESVKQLISRVGGTKYDLAYPLERDRVYLARLRENMSLPEGVYGYSNPKSTTGRLDVHVRLVADGVPRFDALYPKGYKGPLWALITPRSFAVLLHKRIPLTQLRLFTDDTRLDELELQIMLSKDGLLFKRDETPITYERVRLSDKDGSLILTTDLQSDVVGYECLSPGEVLDIGKIDHYDPSIFFRPVQLSGGNLRLEKDRFYILSTHEFVRVPPHLACEMRPMDDRAGEYRVHYAGFIDPGWGWGEGGNECGRPLTLEVRPHENLIIAKGQPIAKVRFERMKEVPSVHYDVKSSNYSVQSGPKLAKQFTAWPHSSV